MKATKTNKCINTGGVLYEKYTSLRQKLIKYEVIPKGKCLPHGTYINHKRITFFNPSGNESFM